jgi:hypothetical protein
MAFMLIILVPLAILAAVVLVHDLKRRRRPAAAVDVAARVRAVRNSTEAKGITNDGSGGGWLTKFAARRSGLASGLALAVRPAGLAEAPGSRVCACGASDAPEARP